MESGKDDCELVRSILNGYREDFRILVKKYNRLVAHIVCRLVPDREEKDDLGQEIFIKIYQALPSFEFRSTLATWISKIAYNCCLNYLRKKKMLQKTAIVYNEGRQNCDAAGAGGNIETAAARDGPPDATLIQDEINRFLHNAINTLPTKFRTIVTLYYLDNMSHRNIAKIMGLPIGSVKVYLFRARKMIKDELLSNYDMEDLCL